MLDLLLLALRLVLGAYFVTMGWNKLFAPQRREGVPAMLAGYGVPAPRACYWLISLGELFGGLALWLGFLYPVALMGLVIICLGALCLAGLPRLRDKPAINWGNRVNNAIGLTESLLILLLLALFAAGPGRWSLDALAAAWGIGL